MGRQIVDHQDISRPERGRQELLHVSKEGRAIQHQRRDQAVLAESCDESRSLPVALRHGVDNPLSLRAAAEPARHVGDGPGFIQKHQPGGVERSLSLFPVGTGFGHIGSILLGRAQLFF